MLQPIFTRSADQVELLTYLTYIVDLQVSTRMLTCPCSRDEEYAIIEEE